MHSLPLSLRFDNIFLLSFALSSATGQTILQHQKIYSDANAYSYRSIDLNSDGLMDIASFTSANQKAEIYLNQGNFVFKYVDASVGVDNKQIKGEFGFVDYDGDGDMDIISAQCSACANREVTLYENNDFKTFDKKLILAEKFGGFSDLRYQSGDFNMDGFDDFILSGDGTKIFYNTGQNSFEEPVSMGSMNGTYLDALDLNQDGFLDLIMFNADAAYTFLNSASGFSSGQLLADVKVGYGNVDKYDINKDGIEDYYVETDQCLEACISTNDGTYFGPLESIFCSNFLETTFAPIHANGDDHIDVLSGVTAGGGIHIRENNGNGFDDRRIIGDQGFQISYFLLDDFNNDGYSDVVYFDKWRDMSVLEGKQVPDSYFAHMIATDTKVRIQNIDGDQQSDMIVFDENWLGINLFDRDLGEFGGLRTLFNFKNRMIDAKAEDMDGDGDQDLIIVMDPNVQSVDQSSVIWAEQVDGNFNLLHTIQSGERDYSSLNVEDFDKDGDVDLVIHRQSSGGEYLMNNGDNTFNSTPIYARGRYTRKVDLNQDGWTDILAWENGGSTFHYIENDQMGGFKDNQRFGDEQTIYDVESYDWDYDGDQDIILSVYEFPAEISRIKLYENNNSTFESVQALGNDFFGTDLVLLPVTQDQLGIAGSNTLDTYLQDGADNWQFIEGPTDETYSTIERFVNVDEGKLYILATGSDDPGIHLYSTVIQIEDADNDGFSSEVDCDDSNAEINPDAEEIVNNDVDENCDGIIEVIDIDQDGFNSDEDCDDANPDINPDAQEIPGNGIDENCDGEDVIVLVDNDNDGFLSDVDCDDDNAFINPDQYENIANTIDDNCDGVIEEQIYAQIALLNLEDDVNDFIAQDIDDDGIKDLVFATYDNIYYSSSVDNFSTKNQMITISSGKNFTNIKIADMDNDGDDDLVFMTLSNHHYGVIVNFDGTYVSQHAFHEVEDMVSFDLAYLDNDDLPDMLFVRSGNTNHPKLGYKLNNGSRFFGDEVGSIDNALTDPVSIHAVHINDDDDIDYVIRQQGPGHKLVYYLGTPGFGFGPISSLCTVCNEIGALTIGEWNGIESLIFSNLSGPGWAEGLYSWPLGKSTNDFTSISDAKGVNNISLGRVNANCGMDLVYSSTSSKRLDVLMDDDQLFGLESALASTMDIMIKDLTGDHKPEVVFYNENQSGLVVLESLQPATDHDQDGFMSDEDCDDCDNTMNPDAEEDLENGIDDNCDGVVDDLDEDMDGYGQMVDCDDTNPDVNPGAEEIPDNGIDDDCFGGDEQSQYNITTYAEAKAVDAQGNLVNEGRWAKLTGIIHGVNFLESSNLVQMVLSNSNDEGIWLFSSDNGFDIPEEGDEVTIRGELLNFNGLAELVIHSVEFLSYDNALFEPKLTEVIGEKEEGDFVRFRNFQFLDESYWKGNGSSFNVPITNGSDVFILRIDNDTELASSPMPASPFDVIGLCGQFDQNAPFTDSYQVFPRYITDFQNVSSTTDKMSTAAIYPTVTKSFITIGTDKTDVKGIIYFPDGRVAKEFTGKNISLSHLNSGLYILKCNMGSGKFVKI
ncbi:MAG: FG-GAP-like repeat-containing protein [Bacteroidota bacterium]